jgi:hypothetical protein
MTRPDHRPTIKNRLILARQEFGLRPAPHERKKEKTIHARGNAIAAWWSVNPDMTGPVARISNPCVNRSWELARIENPCYLSIQLGETRRG